MYGDEIYLCNKAVENNKLAIQTAQVKIQSYSCFKPDIADALGYNVFAINLDKNKTYYFKAQTQDISSIAGQTIHKIDSETFAIDNYQERGGNFIIFLDSGLVKYLYTRYFLLYG